MVAKGWSIVDVETRLPSLVSSIVGGAVVIRNREVYAVRERGGVGSGQERDSEVGTDRKKKSVEGIVMGSFGK